MDPNELTEFQKRLPPSRVQWVVEWWRITSMVNRVFKDNYIPLVGLRLCSFYSTCRIARQFDDRQGAPSDDGLFHTLAFTNRIFSKIRDAWLRRMVAKDICFPRFLHPTSGYKAWLAANIRLGYREERITGSPTKGRRLNDYLDMP